MNKHGLGLMALAIFFLVLSACAGPAQAPTPQSAPAKAPAIAGPPGSGWQARWDETLAAARKEGKVTVYAELASDARTVLTRAFKDRFGIEMETLIGTSQELASKYIQESKIGINYADLLFAGSGTFLNNIKPNVQLARIEPELMLPEVLDSKVWPEGNIPFADKDRLVVQSTLGRALFAIANSDLVKDGEITSFRDYLHPKWKGKIVIFDPTIAGSTTGVFGLLLVKIYGLDEGKKYLSKLAQQEPAITRDKRLPVEWVARGRYPLHIGPNRLMTTEFIQAGAPLRPLREKEGGLLSASSSCFALVANPAHPNAARVLVNWLLTVEGGTILSKTFNAPSARRDVSTAGLDPANVALPGEKNYLHDEELVLFNPTSYQIARDLFGHLIK